VIEDNKSIEGLSLSELKEQRIYAIRNLASWREKLSSVLQPDSKVICRREIAYWQCRKDAIHHALFYHPERY
jgi:hypothetical protein